MKSHSELVSFIWSVADLLRGDYRQADYGKVILPFTVLRRLDCALEPTRAKVRAKAASMKGGRIEDPAVILDRMTGVGVHNASDFDFASLVADPSHVTENLAAYLAGFSTHARDILERFGFAAQVEKLAEADLLYLVLKRFAEVDLHPKAVPNHVMGTVFEELIRRFAEQSNETAGEHFTPREVIRLMVDLLYTEGREVLTTPGVVRTLFDPACGTGGMLSVAEEYLHELNAGARLEVFGQELNDESYAICKADMLMKGQNPANIVRGNSFSQDGHPNGRFDYCISNPPFGVEWKKVEKAVRDEAETRGHAGRFGAGLPRINDGSLLFLQHMLSKTKPAKQGGTRIAIVFNGSPLFTGDAGSGESEIRRWILENDWLEAIVALPDQLFYNTGINTYVWILDTTKSGARKGKVQLVNGAGFFRKMRKSLGNKRHELGPEDVKAVARLYGDFEEGRCSKIFRTTDFGFRKITVERPLRLGFQASPERLARLGEEKAFQALARSKKKGAAGRKEAEAGAALQDALRSALARLDGGRLYTSRPAFLKDLKAALKAADVKLPTPALKAVLSALSEREESAKVCLDAKGRPEPDPELRDTENVPLGEDVEAYVAREVLPHVPDAWVDESKTKIGYEIPFTRHFYEYTPLRPLEEIEADIRRLEDEIQGMLKEVLE